MVILGIVTSLLAGILAWLIKMVLTWCISVYDDIFYNVMAVETNFYDVIDLGYFNITGLYTAIYTFAIALLILFFVKKLAETYFAWSNGDPETSPFSILIGFLKAVIIMICFGFIYKTFVEIFHQILDSLLNGGFGGSVAENTSRISKDILSLNSYISVFGMFIYLLVGILWVLIYFQCLGRGIEVLVLRLRYAVCLYWTFKFRWWCF